MVTIANPNQLFIIRNAACHRDDDKPTCILFSQRGNGILRHHIYKSYKDLMEFLTHPCRRCGGQVSVDTEPLVARGKLQNPSW